MKKFIISAVIITVIGAVAAVIAFIRRKMPNKY